MKNEKFIKLWEKEKQKGKTRCVLFCTAIMGISLAIRASIGVILREGWANSINSPYFLYNMRGPFIGSLIVWKRNVLINL